MSIRWKLFLSLFALTAGASALVLGLAEREFRASTREQVASRFKDQIDSLLARRAERLAKVRDACAKLAEDETVRRRLRDPDQHDARDFPKRLEAVRGRLDDRTRGRESILTGVVTLDGELLPLGRPLPTQLRQRRRQPPEELRDLARQPSQEVAYVILEAERDSRTTRDAREVVVTPVRDGDEMLGWFIMGIDARTRDEQIFQRAEEISGRDARTGLVVEDEWLVPGLSEKGKQQLAAIRAGKEWGDDRPDLVEVDGERYYVASAPLNPGSPLGRGEQVTLFPIGSLIDAVEQLRWKVAGIAGLATLASAGIALFLSARFNRPIAALVAGTERIRRGEFDEEVEVRSKDELGHLAGAFNRMTHDLALKERYHEVLGKVSDPAVARRLMEGELELGGEVVEAAVLFCDIRGFTAMTDGMPPAGVIELLNEHMTALTRVVAEHGGVVDKFVGDLVMALFGAPQSHGDDALRAARCAIAMLEERRKLDESTGRVVEIGIGVACGPLVAGCMGSRDRLNYTVLGDRVNLASRLCSAAGPGEVVVDQTVADAARDEFTVGAGTTIALKGFARPVATFALTPRPR